MHSFFFVDSEDFADDNLSEAFRSRGGMAISRWAPGPACPTVDEHENEGFLVLALRVACRELQLGVPLPAFCVMGELLGVNVIHPPGFWERRPALRRGDRPFRL